MRSQVNFSPSPTYSGAASIKTLVALALVCFSVISVSAAPDPYGKPDESWISISGAVQDKRAHAFTLNYGNGSVIVEMDAESHSADVLPLQEGDKVTVLGVIDRDLFERTSIEASSVYVQKLDAYFHASAVNERGLAFFAETAGSGLNTFLQGVVTQTNEAYFLIDTGEREFRVDIKTFSNDLFKDPDSVHLLKGDVVRVTGKMDSDFLNRREFIAQTLKKIESDRN